MNNKEPVVELPDDIEVVGPGQILAEARENLGYSQKYVAEKLNFRLTLVVDIENEKFDEGLPATYNRGYLKNYAKLVNASAEDVLSSYEMLGVAQTQSAEMQSFSKSTEKQAQNKLLMWISYLIFAILIGTTAMWFLQERANVSEDSNQAVSPKETQVAEPIQQDAIANRANSSSSVDKGPVLTDEQANSSVNTDNTELSDVITNEPIQAPQALIPPVNSATAIKAIESIDAQPVDVPLADMVFTFSGDCWVNIYDGNGERIAWGIKKSGYEMKISASAPVVVTLGKPELVSINYNGQAIDMSQFSTGNIAKFSLPIISN